jgi:ferredoxin
MNLEAQSVKISFIINDDKTTIDAKIDDTILDIKHKYPELLKDLECACEGSLACSTCHVIVAEEYYDKTFHGSLCPSDEENDMLDLAPNVTKTSRLGCQLKIKKDLDGACFIIPCDNRNFS